MSNVLDVYKMPAERFWETLCVKSVHLKLLLIIIIK